MSQKKSGAKSSAGARKQATEKKAYRKEKWSGRTWYYCEHCSFDTHREERMRRHVRRHR